MSTKVCLVLAEKTIEKNLALLKRYKNYIDMAELRADCLNQNEILFLRKFPEKAEVPAILTVRRKSDGGFFTGGEGARMTIFARGLAYASGDPSKNFAYIDLESDFAASGIEDAAAAFGIQIIRSLHAKKPVSNIAKTVKELLHSETDIAKLAFPADSLNGMTEAFKAVKQLDGIRYIISVMGKYGITSRILSKKLSSEIVYTFSTEYIEKKDMQTELIDPITLHALYGFSHINKNTAVYGVIGKDINTSLSPHIHNKGFKKHGIDAVYVPVSATSAKEALTFAETAGLRAFSVTAPFKMEIIPEINGISGTSKSIGAVNTVIREEKKWIGYDTDADGFRQALTEFLHTENLSQYKIAIIGAGGAAKAVADVIKNMHGKVCIFNRTAEHARQLANRYNFKWALLNPINIKQLSAYSGLIIQTTNVGMEPDLEADPLTFYTFTGKEKIFELIYRPEKTALLKRAEEAGCQTCNGYKMLEYQAHHQFKAFTGTDYE